MLPAPNLDDRRFQELVDEAKRRVQQECPEWTDHNVSDPGVMLIELFAWMTDQLVYRLNRVPDRLYVKFLELLGLTLYPATAARVPLTFRLSGEVQETVTIPSGYEATTEVATLEDILSFHTRDDLVMPPSTAVAVATGQEGQRFDETGILHGDDPFNAFQEVPRPGDELLIGLDDAKPRCAIELTFDCQTLGVGVDPEDPPLVWEAWDGRAWVVIDHESDETGGLNRPGSVTLHLPPDHGSSTIAKREAGWLRCRVVEARDGQPTYTESPQVRGVSARTVGGTVEAVHARTVTDEVIGLSEGIPGQEFELLHRPVLGGNEPVTIEVAAGHGWDTWTEVDAFSESGPADPVFVLDRVAGRIRFGPSVRLADGSLRGYGAVPPAGAPIRVPRYETGGGSAGNVAVGTVTHRTTDIPFVNRVTNRRPGLGGVDPEDMENAKARGPRLLHTRNRAVTLEDYELLAREAAPEIARVKCVTDGEDPVGGARVLVVPAVAAGRLAFADLLPSDETLERVAALLEERRTIGARVIVEPPSYQGMTVVASVRARSTANIEQLQDTAVEALYGYFHPVTGGPAGTGWPFGRPIHAGEVYSVLQAVDGIDWIQEARLFPADPISGERHDETERLILDPTWLVFSYEHRVRVTAQE